MEQSTNTAQAKFDSLHEFLMAILLMEEKLKKEFIEDELTGVYLIPRDKLDGIIKDLKQKAKPIAVMYKQKHITQYQRVLNGITKDF